MPFVAFVNKSRHIDNWQADMIVAALRRQAIEDFKPLWPGIELWVPLFVADDRNLPGNAYPIAFVDEADTIGSLAYHSVDGGGKYFGHVFVDLLLERSADPFDALAIGAGHEYFEMIGDPSCSRYVAGPKIAEGYRYAFELSDPVQGVAYPKTIQRFGRSQVVQCTDVVGPAWFGQGSGPLSICNAPPAAFQLARGGYMMVANTAYNDRAVWGEGTTERDRVEKLRLGRRARASLSYISTGIRESTSPDITKAELRRYATKS